MRADKAIIAMTARIDPTARVGAGTKVHDFVFIGPNVRIGQDCRIQAFAFIPEHVLIADNVFIGPHVCFTNDKYPPSQGEWRKDPPTLVEDDVSIGANATILPGLLLRRGCRIGAGAVVTRHVEPYAVVAGIPAGSINK